MTVHSKLMHDLESKQEMLNILAVAVTQIIHAYIHNLKQMSNIDFSTRLLFQQRITFST